MDAVIKEIIGRAKYWPAEDQKDLALTAREIEMRRKGEYRASASELAAIDDGLAAVRRGEFADDAEVRSLLAKYGSRSAR